MASADPKDIELFTIGTEVPESRSLVKNKFDDAQEHEIPTAFGTVQVAVQGNTKKPAILTYHDVGLNHVTCFQGFFQFSDMKMLLEHFCVYHVNAPGQHDGSVPLLQGQIYKQKDGYKYPTMDELAETVFATVSMFELKTVIGFGVGAGANILSRFALRYPDRIEAMILVNPQAGACSWLEWGYQKFNSWYLKSGNLTTFTEDYLLWHWFGRSTVETNSDLVHVYKQQIKAMNPVNLALFIDTYSARTDLNIQRPTYQMNKDKYKTIRCPAMLIIGDHGPSVDETVDMNARMNPAETTLVKLADCGGMVLEEAPAKLAESMRLFLQGQGYVPFLSQTKIVAAREAHKAIPTDLPPAIASAGDSTMPMLRPDALQPAHC